MQKAASSFGVIPLSAWLSSDRESPPRSRVLYHIAIGFGIAIWFLTAHKSCLITGVRTKYWGSQSPQRLSIRDHVEEDTMNKFLSVMFAAILLTVAFLPASAAPPEPVDYRITQGGSCWLPDGSTRPVSAESVKQNFHWTTPIRLVALCAGPLPKGAELPKETSGAGLRIHRTPVQDHSRSGHLCYRGLHCNRLAQREHRHRVQSRYGLRSVDDSLRKPARIRFRRRDDAHRYTHC